MNIAREKHLREMGILEFAINSNWLSAEEKENLKLRLKKMATQLELFDKEMGIDHDNTRI